jgi:hypothetical protein
MSTTAQLRENSHQGFDGIKAALCLAAMPTGSRLGQHSIRINDQYRICFVWRDGDVYEVEIVDYH